MAKAQFVFLISQPPAKAGGNWLYFYEAMVSIDISFMNIERDLEFERFLILWACLQVRPAVWPLHKSPSKDGGNSTSCFESMVSIDIGFG